MPRRTVSKGGHDGFTGGYVSFPDVLGRMGSAKPEIDSFLLFVVKAEIQPEPKPGARRSRPLAALELWWQKYDEW